MLYSNTIMLFSLLLFIILDLCKSDNMKNLTITTTNKSRELSMNSSNLSINDNGMVYLHIPKTGGTSLRHHIPDLLELTWCNSKYHIQSCCTKGIPKDKLNLLKYPSFGNNCKFLDYEWGIYAALKTMKSIGYYWPKKYNILTSFREPLSHFFSAFEHIQAHFKSDSSVTLDSVINNLKNNKPDLYNLKSFQANFMSTSKLSLQNSVENMKKLYWFSLNEEYELSFKLLQCQLYGKVDEKKLESVLSHSYNVRSSQKDIKYQFSSQNLVDIKSLIDIDIKFYQMIVVEFRKRVNKYSTCIQKSTNLKYMKNMFDLTII